MADSSHSQPTNNMSTKTLLSIGVGTGISAAVARKFAANGYKLGLISLKLEDAQKVKDALPEGCEAHAFEADAGDPAALAAAVAAAKAALGGAVTVVHLNAAAVAGGDPLAEGAAEALVQCCRVGVVGLAEATRLCRADLKAAGGAVLVTSSGVSSTETPAAVDEFLNGLNIAGYCVGKAAQMRLAKLLIPKLKADGIFVGIVKVNATVVGTAWDAPAGSAKIQPDAVADAFWGLLEARADNVCDVDNPPEA